MQMIRHCVFIRFAPAITDDQKREIFREITALQARVPGFLAAYTGSNVSPETGMDKGYSDGFILDFVNGQARDAYLRDPEHQRVGARIVEAAVNGADGVLVFDLAVSESGSEPIAGQRVTPPRECADRGESSGLPHNLGPEPQA